MTCHVTFVTVHDYNRLHMSLHLFLMLYLHVNHMYFACTCHAAESISAEDEVLNLRPGPRVNTGGSIVQRYSMGYEKLEANARDTEIKLGAEGR